MKNVAEQTSDKCHSIVADARQKRTGSYVLIGAGAPWSGRPAGARSVPAAGLAIGSARQPLGGRRAKKDRQIISGDGQPQYVEIAKSWCRTLKPAPSVSSLVLCARLSMQIRRTSARLGCSTAAKPPGPPKWLARVARPAGRPGNRARASLSRPTSGWGPGACPRRAPCVRLKVWPTTRSGD